MLRPLGNNVVLKEEALPDKVGSILIPKTAQKKEGSKLAKVLAIGPGKDGVEIPLKKDETVILGAYAGTEVEVEGDKLLVVDADQIQGVVET